MAINPLRGVTNFDVPVYPQARGINPDPSVWTNIASLGGAYAKRREDDELTALMQSATDANGNLDLQKAATAIALSGRDPIKYINALTARESGARSEAAQKRLSEHYDANEKHQQRLYDLAREKHEAGDVTVEPPSLFNPGRVIRTPPKGPPIIQPFPQPVVPPPAATPGGGQSALPPLGVDGPALALNSLPPEPALPSRPGATPLVPRGPLNPLAPPPIGPGGPGGQRIGEVNPEEGAPYQIAGEPVAAPRPGAVPKTPEGTVFNDAFLRTLPPNAQTIVKGVATYDIDPSQFQGRDRDDIIAAAKLYRPDYKMSEYQKRAASPPSAEVEARLSLGQLYLTRAPAIRERILAGEYTDARSKMLAVVGQGGPGELRRAIDEGADGVQRLLTGAGMNKEEAGNYSRRYQFDIKDTKDTALRKSNELESVLRYLVTGVGQGRGGKDLIAGFEDQFGKPVLPEKPKVKQVTSDAEVNDLIGKANKKLGEAASPEARAQALTRVHSILKERGVPPQFWPR